MGIQQKLSNVQTTLNAPKNQYNAFGKYNYRNCEDILEALKPHLKDNGLTIKFDDFIEMVGDRFYVKSVVTLTDIETGEVVQNAAYAREEESKKGMDGSQVTGASSSYARKYALNGMFCIDDNKDSDSTNKHGKDKEDTAPAINNGINDKQIKRLYAIASKAGYDAESIKGKVKKKYNKEIKELTKAEYDHVCNGLEERANG